MCNLGIICEVKPIENIISVVLSYLTVYIQQKWKVFGGFGWVFFWPATHLEHF